MADKDSRTEQATPKRAQEARNEGRIARSADLVAWTALLAGFTVVQSTVVRGGRLLQQLMNDTTSLIAQPDQGTAIKFLATSMESALRVIAPLIVTFVVLGVLGHFAQVRFVLALKALKPNFRRLDPISGAKRLASSESIFTAGKQVVKTAILSYVAYRTLWTTVETLAQGGPYATHALITMTCTALVSFVREVAMVGITVGAIEYLYQRKRIKDSTKMSKTEVRQEQRTSDGNPEMKGRIRQKQFQISRNRMMQALKDADVVVVNPIHVAVALKYDALTGAPRVIAKGAGFLAEKIREKAEEHNVPMVQDIPLARTLHRICDLDDEIPAEMFEAVARVLAFVFALRNRGTAQGFHKMPGTPDLEEYEAQEAIKLADEKVAAGGRTTLGVR